MADAFKALVLVDVLNTYRAPGRDGKTDYVRLKERMLEVVGELAPDGVEPSADMRAYVLRAPSYDGEAFFSFMVRAGYLLRERDCEMEGTEDLDSYGAVVLRPLTDEARRWVVENANVEDWVETPGGPACVLQDPEDVVDGLEVWRGESVETRRALLVTEMRMDLLKLAPLYDAVVVVSGNGVFASAFRSLRRNCPQVLRVVASFDETLHRAFRRRGVSDEIVTLGEDVLRVGRGRRR